jgi:hypothetical protein
MIWSFVFVPSCLVVNKMLVSQKTFRLRPQGILLCVGKACLPVSDIEKILPGFDDEVLVARG